MGLRSLKQKVRGAGREIKALYGYAALRWAGRREKRADLAICAIFKDELPYILEWVAWYRLIGAGQLYIADNDSTDGTTELLAALQRKGYVTHLPFPRQPGRAPQLDAYNTLMARYRARAKWFAFFDADEFLMPSAAFVQGRFPVLDHLASRKIRQGAIALNWSLFGASGRDAPGDGPVIERFQNRAEQSNATNRHIKSIARGWAWRKMVLNPHATGLSRLTYFGDSSGAYIPFKIAESGLTDRCCWENLRLNHYVVKSRHEFFYRKARVGRADMMAGDTGRNQVYFAEHDRNEVPDSTALSYLPALKAEIERIRADLTDVPDAVLYADRTLNDRLVRITASEATG